VEKQKTRYLLRQEEAGALLQVVSVATPGEGAATYLAGELAAGAGHGVRIVVEQALQIVPPLGIVADIVQPIQLRDAVAGHSRHTLDVSGPTAKRCAVPGGSVHQLSLVPFLN
jgi:hypothetical protein